MQRSVFMISDGTGITVESLGNSLLTQFASIEFVKQTIPYIDSLEKAQNIIETINTLHANTGIKPLVFLTVVNPNIRQHIASANAHFFDLFQEFLAPLENALETKSSYTVGRLHRLEDITIYDHRIEAINYALTHDDGLKPRGYEKADIILIGVSRCGKTPSCLYMALQFGILAANYPFTDEDLSTPHLPNALQPYKERLFGLTIDPQRLQHIRTERRPNSTYATAEQCRREVVHIETMYRNEHIRFLNSTHFSIEEITTRIMASAGLKRRI